MALIEIIGWHTGNVKAIPAGRSARVVLHSVLAPQGMMVGFIGYSREQQADSDEVVRVFLECRQAAGSLQEPPEIEYGYGVDVVFPGGGEPCHLRGVDGVLVLKKFYKLVLSLEERAREHGNDWRAVMGSAENLLKHLAYTRNARDFTGQPQPRRAPRSQENAEPECLSVSKGS